MIDRTYYYSWSLLCIRNLPLWLCTRLLLTLNYKLLRNLTRTRENEDQLQRDRDRKHGGDRVEHFLNVKIRL